MKRASLGMVLAGASIAALVACGSLSDPERTESVSQVSGALTGAGISGVEHVALVWRVGNSNQWVVGNDVPLVGGKFTMAVVPPSNEYFARSKETFEEALWAPAGTEDSADAVLMPDDAHDGGIGSRSLRPLADTVSGGYAGGAVLESALAGLVVYVDKNGNGHLDLEGTHLTSPDEIVGGNDQLVLHCFRGGGALSYEKLRDKAGVLPSAGCHLGWTQGRWLPADKVELQVTAKHLPFSVCSRFTTDDSGQVCTPNERRACHCPDLAQGTQVCDADGRDISTCTCEPNAKKDYPRAGDPLLRCNADGSWSYRGDPTCPPTRLCDYVHTPLSSGTCTSGSSFFEAPRDTESKPDGWPCPWVLP